ncbi:DUF7452 domain-containing protein [Hyunsoonleella pacifica]|uniref:DUF7452 domain-containing protein n=1 Tax=Hyunsoonleella pacifica TaxID=1080224 RepID=A0A4Q9FPZ6_9FLAO|nr:hypothetical protein [Hyunsoonleella pacifica]TBN17501.1 hypothetical protein EYD46_04075 [Hyunsoonleella pacifica]
MKTFIYKTTFPNLSLLVVLLLVSINVNAQSVFKHTASTTNTNRHISSINHASTNGKKDKILIVTHDYGKSGPYQTKAYGVWYNGKKWTIFNQDKSPMTAKTQFNVLVVNKSANAFTVKAGTNSKSVKLNHAKLNNNPNAAFLITPNWGASGPYNKSPIGVYYASGRWHIFNTDGKSMPTGAKFNVFINSKIFKHKVTNANRKRHITYINNSTTNNKPNALVFTTFNSQTSIKSFNNPLGVWYSANKWTIYNENRKLLAGNEAYNMLSLPSTSSSIPIVYKPVIKKPPVVIKTEKTPTKVDSEGLRNIGLVKYKPIRTNSGTPTDKERKGPDITKYEDIESTLEGDNYVSFLEKLNVFRKIYKDQNTNSNVYYYFPAEYTLKWNKDTNEYAFNIYYMSSEGGKGSVLVNAELTPQVSSEDVKLAEKLLAAKLKKPVKLMPMDLRDVPKVDFGATLTNFNVKAESINSSVPSDYHKPIILDWRMDSNIDDFVGAMLNNIGVNINLEFRPYGDETTVINVPVNLEVNSPMTFGKIEFNQTTEIINGWTNTLDYPIIPKQLVLQKKQGNKTYFETVVLQSNEIPTSETLHLDDTTINKLQSSNNITALWLDYALNKDCNTCNQEVKKKIIGGTSGSQITNLEIQVLNVLEYTDAHSMKLLIKSVQADPNGVNEITFPAITIAEDGQTHEGIQLFVPEGKELFYQYQLITIKKDGEVQTSAWQNSSSSLLVLGESQIKSMEAYNEKSDIEKAKDSAIEKGKEKLIEKGKEILEDIFSKKEDDKKENSGNGSN